MTYNYADALHRCGEVLLESDGGKTQIPASRPPRVKTYSLRYNKLDNKKVHRTLFYMVACRFLMSSEIGE